MSSKIDPGVGASPDPPAPSGRHRTRLLLWLAGIAAGVAAVTLVGAQVLPSLSFAGTKPARKAGPQTTNCQAVPSKCGFPDATNTGVLACMTLKSVPGQVSSGPGWRYNSTYQEVEVTGNGAVLTGLSISGGLNITGSNVTINGVKVVAGGTFGVSLRHTSGVTIENSTISGQNATSGRVAYAIDDVYGDSTGMTIKNNNISAFRTAAQVSNGVISGNYIHDPGYLAGDHTNGIYVGGGTRALTISGNTILNSIGQTDAINLDSPSGPGQPVANKTVTGNLLAGGGYVIYGGAASGNPATNVVIKNNDFGQAYFARSGQWGAIAYFNSGGSGNTWSGNTWDTTGAAIPAP